MVPACRTTPSSQHDAMEAWHGNHEPSRKAQGFRPNIFQPTNPSSVSNEPESSSSTSKKPHIHGLRHHHHTHRHKHSRHARSAVHSAVHSAVQLHPPTSFGDLLKQASRSKHSSPHRSRRQSSARAEQQGVEEEKPPPRVVRPEDVSREKTKTQAQEVALRASLQNLSDQSLKTSRQLDDTYYSILEKLSVVRQTIGSLQELSGLTKELHEHLLSDTNELTEDIRGQIQGFNNFEEQERQIEELAERTKVGKEKTDALNVRLAEARRRVEARAKAEAMWEARTSRRLKVLWGILGTIAGLMVLAILFQRFRPTHDTKYTRPNISFATRNDLSDAPIPDGTKEAILNPLGTRSSRSVAPCPSQSVEMQDDGKLRVFDEL